MKATARGQRRHQYHRGSAESGSSVSGTWQMAYVLQKGLNLGQPYTVANYPTSLNPATGGLATSPAK